VDLHFADGLAEAGADITIFNAMTSIDALCEIDKIFRVKIKDYQFVIP